MGLTEDDLPTNLIDLCAFITRWNDEWYDDEDKANVMPLCTIDIRGTIFNILTPNSYISTTMMRRRIRTWTSTRRCSMSC